ncbi:MAG: hypothetical protein ACK4WM_11060 [Thermoflexales bacterium]
MDYAELFEAVKGYVENDFPDTSWTNPAGTGTVVLTSTEQINTFIRQAERRIYRDVEVLVSYATAAGALTANDWHLAIPSDWLWTLSFAVVTSNGRFHYLLQKDFPFIRAAYPNPSTTGLPRYYAAKSQTQFVLGPTPDSDYAYEMSYYRYPESIVTAGTTWVGDNFEGALLYGALLEAYTFMKGEADVLQQYQMRYDVAMAQMKAFAEGKARTDDYRSGQRRFVVP